MSMIPSNRRAGRVAWCVVQNFLQDNCSPLSAAIAFYTMLSLAPALYLIGFGG
jgi:uncharacterized BrkB/YihY/UPF0761 family membrane protein